MVEPAKKEQSSILLIFIFTLLCGASKGLRRPLRSFCENLLKYHKEVLPQRSAKIKFKLIFVLTELSEMQRAGRVKNNLKHSEGMIFLLSTLSNFALLLFESAFVLSFNRVTIA